MHCSPNYPHYQVLKEFSYENSQYKPGDVLITCNSVKGLISKALIIPCNPCACSCDTHSCDTRPCDTHCDIEPEVKVIKREAKKLKNSRPFDINEGDLDIPVAYKPINLYNNDHHKPQNILRESKVKAKHGVEETEHIIKHQRKRKAKNIEMNLKKTEIITELQ